MILNYFKTAWRSIVNNKFYSGINVIGLTVGLVVGLFMLLWVQDELSYDKFNKKGKDIYRIGIIGGTGPTQQIFSVVIAPVATYAKNEVPGVEDAVRIMNIGGNVPFKYKDKVFTEEGVAFTDPSFFSVFDFNLIRGNTAKPFDDNNSLVISESLAKKYFGNEDPIGKTVQIGKDETLHVSGVMADAPNNSSLQYKMLLPLTRFNQLAYVDRATSYNSTGRLASMDTDWINFSFQTYLLLKPGTDVARVNKQLQKIHERNKPDDAPVPYVSQPLYNMHLYRADGSNGGIESVRIFAIVAIMILVIACINYVNLSTSRSMLRAKEVSMRKIIGAGKFQLFMQFVVETTLLFTIATGLALGIMYVALPVYNDFAAKQLTLSLSNYEIWLCIALTLAGTLAATSIYPALLLSSFEPLKALKGKIAAGFGNVAFRRVLVVVQFSVSVILIIGTLIIGNQLKYIRNKNLGYNKENVLSFMMRDNMHAHYDAVKAELMKQPGVLSVTRTGGSIINNDSWTGDNDWDGKPEKSNLLLHPINVDESFFNFFNIKMAQGSAFTGAVADSAHYIINETAAKAMGLKDPVGKRMRVWKVKGTISGVVKDFHTSSLHKKIEPLVLIYNPVDSWRVYVKTTGEQAQQAVAASEKEWKRYNGQIPFNYDFLDESFNNLYKKEQQISSLFNLFSAVAILLSCLGLLGLATYTAQVKTREIGIRKVLGASITGIIQLLAQEFMLLVLVSLVIAVPVAWYVMNQWLADFAYRTHISWAVFVLAGGSAILIAFLTVSFQSVKAALANPVKSLRSE